MTRTVLPTAGPADMARSSAPSITTIIRSWGEADEQRTLLVARKGQRVA